MAETNGCEASDSTPPSGTEKIAKKRNQRLFRVAILVFLLILLTLLVWHGVRSNWTSPPQIRGLSGTAAAVRLPRTVDYGLPRVNSYLNHLRHPGLYILEDEVKKLGDLSDPALVPPLIRAIDDPCQGVRTLATFTLGRIGTEDTVEPLLRVLARRKTGDESAFTAANALGRFSDPQVIAPLIAALDDPDTRVVDGAARSLIALKKKQLLQGKDDPDLVQVLGASIAREKDDNLRENLIITMGQTEDARAIPWLVKVLNNDSDYTARINAARALEHIGDSAATAPLAQALVREPNRDASFFMERSLANLRRAQQDGSSRYLQGVPLPAPVILKASVAPPEDTLELLLPGRGTDTPLRRLTPGFALRQRIPEKGPLHLVSPFVGALAVLDLGDWTLVLHPRHCEVFSVSSNSWQVYTWSDGFPGIAGPQVTAEAFSEGVILCQPDHPSNPHIAFNSPERRWSILDESAYQSLRQKWHARHGSRPASAWRIGQSGVVFRRILPDPGEERVGLPDNDIQSVVQVADRLFAALQMGGIRVFSGDRETGYLSGLDLKSSAPIVGLEGDDRHLAVIHPRYVDLFDVRRPALALRCRLELKEHAPNDDPFHPVAINGAYLCHGESNSLAVVAWATKKRVATLRFESPILQLTTFRNKVIVQTAFGFALYKPSDGTLRNFLGNALVAPDAELADDYELSLTPLGIRGTHYWVFERNQQGGKDRLIVCDLVAEKLIQPAAVGIPSMVEAKWIDYQRSDSQQAWSQGILATLEKTGKKRRLHVLDARPGHPVAVFRLDALPASASPRLEEFRGEYLTQLHADGNLLWVGTEQGLYALDLMTSKGRSHTGGATFQYSGELAVTPNALHIFFDSNGSVGVWCRLDRQTWQSRSIRFPPSPFHPLSVRSRDTRLLFATEAGVGLYDTATEQSRLLPTATEVSLVAFLDRGYVAAGEKTLFLFDAQGRGTGSVSFDLLGAPDWLDVVAGQAWLWIGDRLLRIDPATRAQQRHAIPFVDHHLAADIPVAIVPGSADIPMFLFARDGITGYDPATRRVRFITGDFFTDRDGIHGVCDEGKICYLSTGKGLYRFDKTRLTLTPSCFNPEGLIKIRSTPEAFFLLTHDDGIYRFDRETFSDFFRYKELRLKLSVE